METSVAVVLLPVQKTCVNRNDILFDRIYRKGKWKSRSAFRIKLKIAAMWHSLVLRRSRQSWRKRILAARWLESSLIVYTVKVNGSPKNNHRFLSLNSIVFLLTQGVEGTLNTLDIGAVEVDDAE